MVRKERVCEKENVAFLDSISLLMIFPNNNRLLPIDLEFKESKITLASNSISMYVKKKKKKKKKNLGCDSKNNKERPGM